MGYRDSRVHCYPGIARLDPSFVAHLLAKLLFLLPHLPYLTAKLDQRQYILGVSKFAYPILILYVFGGYWTNQKVRATGKSGVAIKQVIP